MDHASAVAADLRLQKLLWTAACANNCINPLLYKMVTARWEQDRIYKDKVYNVQPPYYIRSRPGPPPHLRSGYTSSRSVLLGNTVRTELCLQDMALQNQKDKTVAGAVQETAFIQKTVTSE